MFVLNNIPVGTKVHFFDSNKVEVDHFDSDGKRTSYSCSASSKFIGFMHSHSKYDIIRLNNAVVEQPLEIEEQMQLNVSEILIPDPIFDNNPRERERKSPFGYMKDKLISLFQNNEDESLDSIYTRIMILASTAEASLKEYLETDPNDNRRQTCPNCRASLGDFSMMINHLTSNGCSLLQNRLPQNIILNKVKLKASLHAIRIARNKLVHSLEISDSEMQEIEDEFQKLNHFLHDTDRWKRLNQIAIVVYTQLQHIIGEAVSQRLRHLASLDFEDYYNNYLNGDLELTTVTIEIKN